MYLALPPSLFPRQQPCQVGWSERLAPRLHIKIPQVRGVLHPPNPTLALLTFAHLTTVLGKIDEMFIAEFSLLFSSFVFFSLLFPSCLFRL